MKLEKEALTASLSSSLQRTRHRLPEERERERERECVCKLLPQFRLFRSFSIARSKKSAKREREREIFYYVYFVRFFDIGGWISASYIHIAVWFCEILSIKIVGRDVKNVKDVDFKGRSKKPRKNVDFKAIVVAIK